MFASSKDGKVKYSLDGDFLPWKKADTFLESESPEPLRVVVMALRGRVFAVLFVPIFYVMIILVSAPLRIFNNS